MPISYATPKYPGGKNNAGLGKFIAERLPRNDSYLEPFFGFGGVLLNLEPFGTEVVNDASSRIVNWWEMVKHHHDEFGERLERTHQNSEDVFGRALQDVDSHPDPIERAVAFTVLLNNVIVYGERKFYSRKKGAPKRVTYQQIWDLWERTKMVYVHNMCALDLMEKYVGQPSVTVYCDPPYPTTYRGEKEYGHGVDYDRMTAILELLDCDVAVSGVGDEWDHLRLRSGEPWWSTGYEIKQGMVGMTAVADTRVEKLWTNYKIKEPDATLFD